MIQHVKARQFAKNITSIWRGFLGLFRLEKCRFSDKEVPFLWQRSAVSLTKKCRFSCRNMPLLSVSQRGKPLKTGNSWPFPNVGNTRKCGVFTASVWLMCFDNPTRSNLMDVSLLYGLRQCVGFFDFFSYICKNVYAEILNYSPNFVYCTVENLSRNHFWHPAQPHSRA